MRRPTARELLLPSVVGTIIALTVTTCTESRREARLATQAYALMFHSTFYGRHRDNLLAFALRRDVGAVIAQPKSADAYAVDFMSLVGKHPQVTVSVSALADFFRDVRRCVEANRCDGTAAQSTFRGYAREFHEVFFPVLEIMDCNSRTPNLEDSVHFFAPSLKLREQSCTRE